MKELGLKLGGVFRLKALAEKTTLQDEKPKDERGEEEKVTQDLTKES